ncbi:hypothetical protein BK809_0000291 [Diplodia seriata]|uniref:AAA+ ATPase domain-containing protein n=1 Tax=Diplodia seriata TaxID=420778 RepID=A0A1S8BCX8_9PEZI|nr:hypothetical protein BK809_0000291 [Diplodia seriata]
MDEEAAKWDRWDRHGVLPSEDDLLLLPDRVFAFVFRSRSWCKGVILLLHGVPGVGKTSTAGDLGITARDVEAKLQYSFQLAQAWDCVLLLDEADIFLGERTGDDISRNALVSVFLRVLEYYEGILFLTTNRVGVIDEAFKSRIHMALYYPPLDKLKTKKIWRSQIRRAKERYSKFRCDEDALIDYADQLWDQQSFGKGLGPVWNGRQIRNAFKSAVALANYHTADGEINLEIHNFEKVARVSNEFNNYFWRVNGKRSDGKIAAENRIRDDSYRVNDMDHSYQQYSAPVADPQTSHGMSRFASAQTGYPTFGTQPVQQGQQRQPIYPSTSGLGGQQFSGIPTQGYVPNPQSQHVAQQPGQTQQGQTYPPSQQQMMPIQQAPIPVQQPPQNPQHAQPFQTVPQSQYVAQQQQLSPQLLHQQMQFSQMPPDSQQRPPQ